MYNHPLELGKLTLGTQKAIGYQPTKKMRKHVQSIMMKTKTKTRLSPTLFRLLI